MGANSFISEKTSFQYKVNTFDIIVSLESVSIPIKHTHLAELKIVFIYYNTLHIFK